MGSFPPASQQDPIRPPLLTHTRHMPSPSHSSGLVVYTMLQTNRGKLRLTHSPQKARPFLLTPKIKQKIPKVLNITESVLTVLSNRNKRRQDRQ